jgi:hypothetical protein
MVAMQKFENPAVLQMCKNRHSRNILLFNFSRFLFYIRMIALQRPYDSGSSEPGCYAFDGGGSGGGRCDIWHFVFYRGLADI